MNENWKENSMRSKATPINLSQRMKKQMRKTNRSISNKGIQKRTMLQRNGVQMRDKPQRMTSNPEEKMVNLSKLSNSDPRIETLLDRRPSDVRHDVV